MSFRSIEVIQAEIDGLRAELKAARAAKTVRLPEVGAVVAFKNRAGEVLSGTVLGTIRGGGKGNPSRITVLTGSGVSSSVFTIFPAALSVSASE